MSRLPSLLLSVCLIGLSIAAAAHSEEPPTRDCDQCPELLVVTAGHSPWACPGRRSDAAKTRIRNIK